MKKLIVTKKYDNKKLSKFITDSFPHLSINTLYKAFRQKDVKVNNSRISKDCIIYSGDEIVIALNCCRSGRLSLYKTKNKILLNYELNSLYVLKYKQKLFKIYIM